MFVASMVEIAWFIALFFWRLFLAFGEPCSNCLCIGSCCSTFLCGDVLEVQVLKNSPLSALLHRFASLCSKEEWVEVLWR